MAGSGTTLVESRLLGRNCFGFDIDPLACLISEVKSTPLENDVIEPAFK
jgi:DNA modification methylase